VIRVSPCPW